MEAAPPSYEKVTLTDYWQLISDYVSFEDLSAAALVCKKWHAVFMPHLWGNPTSHFSFEDDAVNTVLKKFLKVLRISRFSVRFLTHTLHLPSAHAELYDNLKAEWLREVLKRLPRLQSLIVRGVPVFDHAALQVLASDVRNGPISDLRLLDASRCSNVTSHSLVQALKQFDALMYLDLSFTVPARDRTVLATIARLSSLRVLKLRGIGLRDDAVEVLCKSMGTRVRSFDVRDNLVTDRSIHSLLEHCFLEDHTSPARLSPALLTHLGSEMLETYQGEDFEGFLRSAFTGGFISRLAIEDVPDEGVTHLYIAGNQVTIEGVSRLLRTKRLHVVDIGAANASRNKSPKHRGDRLLRVEKLISTISEHTTESLTFLRADHSLITEEISESLKSDLIPERSKSSDTDFPHVPSISASGAGLSVSSKAVEVQSGDAASDASHLQVVNQELAPHQMSVAGVRTARLGTHKMSSHGLHPGMIPRITTLVLTNVPIISPDDGVAQRLIRFIKQCAEEARFARSHALLDYSLPPGRRSQATALKQSERRIFALRRLVLELTPGDKTRQTSRASLWQHRGNTSVTEDRDSEAFWTASERDFSFFGNDENDNQDVEVCASPISPGLSEKELHIGESKDSPAEEGPIFDTVSIISAFRKERKNSHQRNAAAGSPVSETEGYWDGIVQVVSLSSDVRSDGEMDYYGSKFATPRSCQ